MKPNKSTILYKTWLSGKIVGFLLAMMLITTAVSAQQAKVTVTGKVSDKESTEAMIGVGIIEVIGKTSKVIGVTDAKGNFSVQASPDASLTFRFVGYSEYTAKIGQNKRMDIRMSVRQNKLTETVIIGYQSKTRS